MTEPSPAPGESSAAKTGLILLWGAVLIFAAANSVVRLLADLGAANPIDGRNPISFCNVLFVGNLCACLTLIAIYRREWTPAGLRRLSRGDWASLIVLAVISGALAPALIFLALENTTVTNVVLIGRIEPPLLLALSAIMLAERADRWTVIGAAISFAGVAVIVYLSAGKDGLMIGKGELYAALGAVALAVSTVISKSRLTRIPLGIFTVVRTGLGAAFFFGAATYLFGVGHFMDVLTPFVWEWMMVYGAVIIVGGQLCWFKGIKSTGAADVSLATSFTPVAGVFFALLLLGERPELPIIIGGAVIVAGIVVAQVGRRRARHKGAEPHALPDAVAQEGAVGFRGV